MEYNIELKDISIRVPEVDADIKIGLLKTNVTGLSISEMIQAAKELPNIVWNMRQAMELPVDPDNVTLGTPESLEVINKPLTREERIKEDEKNHVSAFKQFILHDYDISEFRAQYHRESGIMFFNQIATDLRYLVVSDRFDEPLEGQVTEWIFADSVELNNVEGGFDIYCNQNLKPSKAMVDDSEDLTDKDLMEHAFAKAVNFRLFDASGQHLKFKYDEDENLGYVTSDFGNEYVIVPHHKEALNKPYLKESLHSFMIREISVNDYRYTIYRLLRPVVPVTKLQPGIITREQLRVGMDISALMKDGAMFVGHVKELTQYHAVVNTLQHKVPLHEMELIVYMRDHFFDEDAVGPEDEEYKKAPKPIEEGTEITFDRVKIGMKIEIDYDTKFAGNSKYSGVVTQLNDHQLSFDDGSWADFYNEDKITQIIFNGYAE